MAIQISGTTVVNDSRQLQNIASVDSTTAAVIAANAGGVTHLGTVVPQSGAISATLSSLTLTDYKMLHINIEGISMGNFQWIGLVGSADKNAVGYVSSLSSGSTISLRIVIDLATSLVFSSLTGYTTTSNGAQGNNSAYAGTHNGQEFSITNSTTSVGVFTRGAGYAFTATGGSIRFYGVA